MEHAHTLLMLACVFGFFMAWGIGANDVANAMGTSVGSGAVTIKQAFIIAIIFESAGAILAGGQVTQTIRSSIIDSSYLNNHPQELVYGMLASLLAAGTWLLVASYKGWPVSTTHSIVGAIIGFAWIELGAEVVNWQEVAHIAASWVVTPVIAGFIGYFVYLSILRLVINRPNPVERAKHVVPFYVFIVAFVIAMVTVSKGLAHLNLNFNFTEQIAVAAGIGLAVMGVAFLILRQIDEKALKNLKQRKQIERVFALLMVFTACAMAFAHGSNDIANAIGPVAAVVATVNSGGQVTAEAQLPIWILLFGAIGMMTGLVMYGQKVIETIGSGITELTPSRGFAASLATASTVVIASGTGLPISTTQTLVGAVLGVGFARGIYALNLGIIGGIFTSWVITLPAGAIFAIIYYQIIALIFQVI